MTDYYKRARFGKNDASDSQDITEDGSYTDFNDEDDNYFFWEYRKNLLTLIATSRRLSQRTYDKEHFTENHESEKREQEVKNG